MNKIKFPNLKKYFFEFLSIFFAVTFAFILNRWNEDRKDNLSENKILTEIYNGLERDSLDLANDENYFKINLNAITYFRKLTDDVTVNNDSISLYYFFLTRDFITIQNTSGYETLKSKGLEIVKNDSLRKSIIDLYEVTYNLHRKFNEEYDENKYMRHYFEKINNVVAPHFIYDTIGSIIGIKQPLQLMDEDRNIIKSYLWRLQANRIDRLNATKSNQIRIGKVRALIKENLKQYNL